MGCLDCWTVLFGFKTDRFLI